MNHLYKKSFSGEYALLLSMMLDSLGVEMQVRSGVGISCISSVPYVLSRIFPVCSFGTWNYLSQIFILLVLVLCPRRFKPGYLISVGLSFLFGTLLDVYAGLIPAPDTVPGKGILFLAGLLIVCFSIWMLQRCLLPILPFDTFTRDMTECFHLSFPKFKTAFDLTCLSISVALSLLCFGHLVGVGFGTFFGAFFTGSIVAAITRVMDRHISFCIKYHTMERFA